MTTAQVEVKPAVKSTQNWANIAFGAIGAVLAAKVPWFQENPEVLVGVSALMNILWRSLITKTKISGFFKTP